MEQPTSDTDLLNPIVLIYSSRSADLVSEWRERFERYRTSAGKSVTLVMIKSDGAIPDVLNGSSSTAVLWDAGAGVPPKELEALLEGRLPSECRAGTRCGSRVTARIRKILFKTSDSNPPCVSLPVSVIKDMLNRLRDSPQDKWSLECVNAAAAAGCLMKEVAVMGRRPSNRFFV